MKKSDSLLQVGAISVTGNVRDENQDRMSGGKFLIGNLYIVTDGMGGCEGGSIAAELAATCIREVFRKAAPQCPVEDVFIAAFKEANKVVFAKSRSGDVISQMGTTAVVLLISGKLARIAHIGDSRAYYFSRGFLSRITCDHTRVQKLVDAGVLKEEEAEQHPDSHILTKAIGIKEEIIPDISSEIEINDGDAFLLCSDGLSGFVTDKEIETILKSGTTPQKVTEVLVNNALDSGGNDNITVQFIQWGKKKNSTSDIDAGTQTPGINTKRITWLLAVLLFLEIILCLKLGGLY